MNVEFYMPQTHVHKKKRTNKVVEWINDNMIDMKCMLGYEFKMMGYSK